MSSSLSRITSAGFATLPTLAFAAEELALLGMVGMPHWFILLRRAELLLFRVEFFVAAVQQVDFRVVERRIVFLVTLAVQTTEETREIRPAFPGELAVEHEYVTLVVVGLDLGNQRAQWFEQGLLDEIFVVEIQRSLDVACIVLVRVATVDEPVGADAVGELAAQQCRERVRCDRFQIRVIATCERQHARLTEITDEIGIGAAALNGPFDVRLGFGHAPLELRVRRPRTRGRRSG